jgi:negative regulator of flagellin synthesis FlgM
MSYTNGIGGLQQALSSIASTNTKTGDASANEREEPAYISSQHIDQASPSSLGGIVIQALEGSDTRSTRVAALQQTIASGSYNISSSAVAERMIDSLLA